MSGFEREFAAAREVLFADSVGFGQVEEVLHHVVAGSQANAQLWDLQAREKQFIITLQESPLALALVFILGPWPLYLALASMFH